MLVLAIFLVLALALLVHGQTEHVVAVNEQDHLKTLAFAEAGVAWVRRLIFDLPPPPTLLSPDSLSDLLDGPDNASSSDDNLIGLRDLSLTASGQFTLANEATASAVVMRDFDGQGARRWELLRLSDGDSRRGHVYVRLDDNWDDAPDNPAHNEPLVNRDKQVVATVVAEYPVFVGTNGVEVPNRFPERGRARRTIVVAFARLEPPIDAVSANGDLDVDAAIGVCGECGNVHTNQTLDVGASASICGDATAAGAYTGSTSGVGGTAAGGEPVVPLPVIDPYDDVLVPEPGVFGLFGCPSDPTHANYSSKYFALVADGSAAGRVYQAYWDAANVRWRWVMVDDLNDGTLVTFNQCGRAGGTGTVANDNDDASFFGFRLGGTATVASCGTCGSSGADASLCTLGANDFTSDAHVTGGSPNPVLPGSNAPDGLPDFDPETHTAGTVWQFSGNGVWLPLYGAVLFVVGNVEMAGSPGSPTSPVFCPTTPAACITNVPNGRWQATIIATGDITISGSPDLAPANGSADYHLQLVAGRDIHISGNVNSAETPCGGNTCPTTGPAGLRALAGIVAAHEQVRLSGDPNLFGFVIAESAVDCSDTVDGQGRGASILDGDPEVYYDCENPPNPWDGDGLEMRSWQERF
jgi:hypothetical protein